MHCNKVSFQELLDCFDNDLGNNLENNADNNLEHNTENSQRNIVYNYTSSTDIYVNGTVCICMRS